MPYLTVALTENLKLQLSPGLVGCYDIQPGNGVGLFIHNNIPPHRSAHKETLLMSIHNHWPAS